MAEKSWPKNLRSKIPCTVLNCKRLAKRAWRKELRHFKLDFPQCDHIGRFIALWATFKSLWQKLFTQITHIFWQFLVKLSKFFIFLVKSFLGNFYRHFTVHTDPLFILTKEYFHRSDGSNPPKIVVLRTASLTTFSISAFVSEPKKLCELMTSVHQIIT